MSLDLAQVCPLTVADALRRAVAIGPDVEAVAAPDGRLTYAELQRSVADIHAALARAGVRRGDHVGLCLGNGVRWLALFLALGSAGAVTVAINTRLKPDEIAYALKQSRVGLLFTADRLLKVDFVEMLRGVEPAIDSRLPGRDLPDLGRVVVLGEDVPAGAAPWAEFMRDAGAPPPPACTPDDVLLIQYTSGSTARPKGVLLTHRSMSANGFFCGQRMGLRVADRFHSARPFFHVAGTSQSILACLQHVATLVTMERFEAEPALALIEAERCTHLSGNDTMALMLLDHPGRPPPERLALRGAWLAASPAVIRRVIDEMGAREAVCAYGLSEASPNVALSCWWEPEAIRVAGRMRPQPGVEVRIRGEQADCAAGEVGEILVRGWNVMKGYYDMPEQTAATLSPDGWLSTGDLGSLDREGRLSFAGRAKDLIRVGGENVSPAEVEEILLRHPKVGQVQVVGVPDPRLIEAPAAFVILREGCSCAPDEIIAWCRQAMAGFKVPRHVRIVESFESFGMTASAKVRKADLRDHAVHLLGLG